MDSKEMFRGFENAEEWNKALTEQNHYLNEAYGMEPLEAAPADVQKLNEQAEEALAFMNQMAASLREGIKHNDEKVGNLIRCHLEFLNKHGHQTSAQDFTVQTRFFLNDDFHLEMLENQQSGLAYYVSAAAESFAATNQ